jgi:uncharacterized protein YbcI
MRNPPSGSFLRVHDGQVLAEISRRIVQLHAEYYGRGPTKARTEWLGPNRDYLICVLLDCFTTVERTLVELGRLAEVRTTRQVFQDAMADKFKALVEQATGRKVIAFMSQANPAPEMAIEFFALEPLAPDAYTSPDGSMDGSTARARARADLDGRF